MLARQHGYSSHSQWTAPVTAGPRHHADETDDFAAGVAGVLAGVEDFRSRLASPVSLALGLVSVALLASPAPGFASVAFDVAAVAVPASAVLDAVLPADLP